VAILRWYETGLDIPHGLSVVKLRERHAQVLIETAEALDLVFVRVPRHAPAERRQRKMAHQFAQKRAGLGASSDSATSNAITVRGGNSMFKSRPMKYEIQ
jgi:hypothetical protein